MSEAKSDFPPFTPEEWARIGRKAAEGEFEHRTITREYPYVYFYVENNKKISVVSSTTRDLNLAVFPNKELVGKIMKDFNIKSDLFVWIDGTEFLIDTNRFGN